MDLNKLSRQMREQKKAHIKEEESALRSFDETLSNVSFVVGEKDITTPLMIGILVVAVPLIGKMIVKDAATEGLGFVDYLGIGVLVVLAGATIYQFFHHKHKHKITIKQKTLYYGAQSWASDRIDYVKCTSAGVIKVCIDGKIAAKANLSEQNAGTFIAWAKKCSIRVINEFREPETLDFLKRN